MRQFTRLAYLTELRDSSKLHEDGLMQQIIKVLAFPPRESFKIRVIFESLYGTWIDLFLTSLNALITFPRAKRPEFIWIDSLNRKINLYFNLNKFNFTFKSIANISRPCSAFRSSQVDKMELGTQIAHIINLINNEIVFVEVVARFLAPAGPSLLDKNTEYRMRTARLFVHISRARMSHDRARISWILRPTIQQHRSWCPSSRIPGAPFPVLRWAGGCSPAVFPVTGAGITRRPLSPVHAKLLHENDGRAVLSWVS